LFKQLKQHYAQLPLQIVAEDIKERVGRPNSRALPLWLEAERIERQQRAG